MNDLSQAFDSPSSPFELKFDPLTGIGVYAKKDLHPQRDSKLVQLLLKGSYSTFESNPQANWSMVSLSIYHRKRGRPSSEDSGHQVKKSPKTVAFVWYLGELIFSKWSNAINFSKNDNWHFQ